MYLIYFSFIFILFLLIFLFFLFRKIEIIIREENRNQKNEIQEFYNNEKDYKSNFYKNIKEEFLFVMNNYKNSINKEINIHADNNFKLLSLNKIEQDKLIDKIEKNIENIKNIITDQFKNSLNFHLEKSFHLIGNQLISLQKGLGEMSSLVQDVNSLKSTLNHIKICGSFSEMQLSMLLEQILSPEQYTTNIITKKSTNYVVEFAIKLPGIGNGNVWLPIDVKFPKITYERLQKAYHDNNKKSIDLASKNMESVIKKMSRDIKNKYIDPPNTTDFGILFLPFEGIYTEVIKKSNLLEELLRKYKTIIAGPSTLAAILNSLQIGFRTLKIQKRTSEVWTVLESFKQEFSKFNTLLYQAKSKIKGASEDIDNLIGVRSRLIDKKLKNIDK